MVGNFGLVTISLLALTAAANPLKSFGSNHVSNGALRSRNGGVHVTTQKSSGFLSSRTPSKSTGHTMSLKKGSSKRINTRSARHNLGRRDTRSGTGIIQVEAETTEYTTTITLGDQEFEVIVDTGSSDTWVPQKGFRCFDEETRKPLAASSCAFGSKTYTPSSTFHRIPNEDLYVEYADGEWGYGYMGNESVTLAGITVDQKIGVIDRAAWDGDNVTSGLLGLAYSRLTGAFSNVTHKYHDYSPIFETMYKQGLVDSYFSLALTHNSEGDAGYLTLGGLPPIDFEENWTSTDILMTNVKDSIKGLAFYTIKIDDVVVEGKPIPHSGGKKIQYVVDSGTSYNYYPNATAKALNDAFDPPATEQDDGSYIVDCSALPPAHGITINGTTFEINPLDMTDTAGQDDDGNDICISQIWNGGADPHQQVYFLGDTFMRNVVSVFDVGAAEMRFAPNPYYGTD